MISRLIKIDKTVRHAVEQADVVLVKKKQKEKEKMSTINTPHIM